MFVDDNNNKIHDMVLLEANIQAIRAKPVPQKICLWKRT